MLELNRACFNTDEDTLVSFLAFVCATAAVKWYLNSTRLGLHNLNVLGLFLQHPSVFLLSHNSYCQLNMHQESIFGSDHKALTLLEQICCVQFVANKKKKKCNVSKLN